LILKKQLTIPIVLVVFTCLVVCAMIGLFQRKLPLTTIITNFAGDFFYNVKNLVGDLPHLLSGTRFISTGVLLEKDYSIYDFRTPFSTDEEEIVFFSDFRSPEVTRSTFESNATTPYARLIERGVLYDSCGNQIGERGIAIFTGKDRQAVRIFWTNGDDFWAIQAPTQKLAMEFERSGFVQSKAINTHCTKAVPTDTSLTPNASGADR
jgi:hypothetical protein